MSLEYPTGENTSPLERVVGFLSRILTHEVSFFSTLVILGFTMTILSVTLLVRVTPSTNFGESIENAVPLWYWLGVALMVTTICLMLGRLDKKGMKIAFLLSCMMLIISVRSVLAFLSPYPPVPDTWARIYVTRIWMKYGVFSDVGLRFFSSGYVRGWPLSFLLAYFFAYVGVPIYAFSQWAPTIIFVLDLIVIYFLFKELANEKIGLVSAFLFTLLNTNSFFPFHYSPQTLGALFYLVSMYAVVKAYKTRKLKHLALAIFSIFVVVLTHHMTTLYLGISLVGAYLSSYFLGLQQKTIARNRLLSFRVSLDTFVKVSLPLSVFTFAIWYFYGFIVYRMDAITMLTSIMKVLTTHQPQYQAGYYYFLAVQSPLSRLSVLMFPVFIATTAGAFLLTTLIRKRSIEGYLWLTLGWSGALFLAFLLGNLMYGNYIDPSRSREIVTLALYPVSACLLLAVFESKSGLKKGLLTVALVAVALFSVFSIYRGAQELVYFAPTVDQLIRFFIGT